MDRVLTKLDDIEKKLANIDVINQRLGSIDKHLEKLNGKVAEHAEWRAAASVELESLHRKAAFLDTHLTVVDTTLQKHLSVAESSITILGEMKTKVDAHQTVIEQNRGSKLAVRDILSFAAAAMAFLAMLGTWANATGIVKLHP